MKIQAFFQLHFRLIALFIWGLFVSSLQNQRLLLSLTGIVIAVFVGLLIYHQQFRCKILIRWLKLQLFTLLLWLTLSWQITAEGIQLNPLGIQLAWLISIRMNLILFSTWIALWQMNDALLVQAISRLPLPAKLIHLFVLTIRYIKIFSELNRKIDIAMKARGYQPQFNRRTLAVSAQRVALLLVHALNRVERAEMALKARAFNFQPTLTKFHQPYWIMLETLIILLLILALWFMR